MPNWCANNVLIRGSADDIKRYLNRLLKDATGKYYPYLSTVPFTRLENASDVYVYVEDGYNDGTIVKFHYRVIDFEVIQNSPTELELNFDTAYSPAGNLSTDDLFPKLSILHKYFEPNMVYSGFNHYVKGKIIASGYEVCEDEFLHFQMYNYAPYPEENVAKLRSLREELVYLSAKMGKEYPSEEDVGEALEKAVERIDRAQSRLDDLVLKRKSSIKG